MTDTTTLTDFTPEQLIQALTEHPDLLYHEKENLRKLLADGEWKTPVTPKPKTICHAQRNLSPAGEMQTSESKY